MSLGVLEPVRVPVGQRIHAILQQLGQNPAWLAEKAGVERSTVTRIIKGDRNPTAETLSNLAPILGLTLDALVVGTDAAARVADAANLVSRAHFEDAVQQVITYERKANDLEDQARRLRDALEQEQAHRASAEAKLEQAQKAAEEARRMAGRHEQAALRYQRAFEQAVADVGRLQTQVAELGQAVDRGRQTGRIAAILAGTAAIASVATYLGTDATKPAAKASPSTKGSRTKKAEKAKTSTGTRER